MFEKELVINNIQQCLNALDKIMCRFEAINEPIDFTSSPEGMEIESALIGHLHDFLLELSNGFSFVALQKRIHIEGMI